MTPEGQFWKHVEKRGPDECWPWTGARTGFGHGHFGVGGKTVLAHRFSFTIHKGDPGKRWVTHNCPGNRDYPWCVNPSHLRLGNARTNLADRLRKATARFLEELAAPYGLSGAQALAILRICDEAGIPYPTFEAVHPELLPAPPVRVDRPVKKRGRSRLSLPADASILGDTANLEEAPA